MHIDTPSSRPLARLALLDALLGQMPVSFKLFEVTSRGFTPYSQQQQHKYSITTIQPSTKIALIEESNAILSVNVSPRTRVV
jgi:hypothetical protein